MRISDWSSDVCSSDLLRSIIVELLWFLRGDTNVRWLQDRKVAIWDEWADESGDLGPVYGNQWRDWATADARHLDQIAELIHKIRPNPASPTQIVTAWRTTDRNAMALTTCPCIFQKHATNGQSDHQLHPHAGAILP